MYKSTMNVRNNGYIHFRTDEYGDIVKTTLARLSELIGNHRKFGTIYLASSGTAVMEATIENCISDLDKCLVINGGGFGRRFCELLKYHQKNYTSVDIKWNEKLTEEHLKPYEDKVYTALFVNIHETTSGQLYDKKMLSDFCKRNGMYFIVDAMSSFMADEYDMDRYGIDVTLITSQKGLCCSPGMAVVSLSERMIEKIYSENNRVTSKYFDYKDYLDNIDRGQTPYTPPVFMIYEVRDVLNLIEEKGGLDAWLNDIKHKGEFFRKRAEAIDLKLPDYPVSNMLTPVIFDDISAYDVIQVLKNEYSIYVNPCGGELASKLVRISHIGDTTTTDIEDLMEKLVLSINQVRKQIR